MSVLSLGKVDEWNGSKFREKEVDIRQGALVLAGQCIALLLSELSSSAEAIEMSRPNGFAVMAAKDMGSVVYGLRRRAM